MTVQYFGLGCFKLTTTNSSVLINPFEAKTGLSPLKGQVDLILHTNSQDTTCDNLGKHIISYPGEYDVAECNVVGLPVKMDEAYHTVFWLEVGGVRFLYTGPVKDWNVDGEEVSKLGDIDVLICAVGGEGVMDASRASKLARELEAKLVIPAYFELPNLKEKFESPHKFLKEMGSKVESVDKLKLTTKDLPAEGPQVAFLLP